MGTSVAIPEAANKHVDSRVHGRMTAAKPSHATTGDNLSWESFPACVAIGESLQQLIHQVLVQNLHRGVTLKELSQFIGYSEKYCSEWFLARMGRSFSSYVKQLRLERATLMLQSPSRLADIAEQLGFQDQYAFSHFFKKTTGLSPKTFRHNVSLIQRSSGLEYSHLSHNHIGPFAGMSMNVIRLPQNQESLGSWVVSAAIQCLQSK